MKIAIGGIGSGAETLWQGDALSTYWDIDRGELVIHGDADNEALCGLISSVLEKRRLRVDIEDKGPVKLRWHGSVRNVEFQSFEQGHAECFMWVLVDN